MGKVALGQTGTWAKEHLSKTLEQTGTWANRRFCKVDRGQRGTWAKRHLVIVALGRTGTWANSHLCKVAVWQTGTSAKWHLGKQAFRQKGTCAKGHLSKVELGQKRTWARHLDKTLGQNGIFFAHLPCPSPFAHLSCPTATTPSNFRFLTFWQRETITLIQLLMIWLTWYGFVQKNLHFSNFFFEISRRIDAQEMIIGYIVTKESFLSAVVSYLWATQIPNSRFKFQIES